MKNETMNSNAGKTCEEIRAELAELVDKYNESTDPVEKAEITLTEKKLEELYAQTSFHKEYTECSHAEYPIVELAKRFTYKTVTAQLKPHKITVNGKLMNVTSQSLVDGEKKFDVQKFIEWAIEGNTPVCKPNWKTAINDCRLAVEKEWKKFFASKGDTTAFSKKAVKTACQAMFDALIFVPCENDKEKNANMATSEFAKWLIGTAIESKSFRNSSGEITLSAEVLSRKRWGNLLLEVLHMSVKDKEFTVSYGTEAEASKAQDKPKTEAEEATEEISEETAK